LAATVDFSGLLLDALSAIQKSEEKESQIISLN
jgi:hypothetical protein